jgi:predicted MFS family arabinose efflux permease
VDQPFLKWSTMAFAVAPFAGGVVFVLSPLYAQRTLSRSPGLIGPLSSGAFRFSVLEVCTGLGAVLGSTLIARMAERRPRGSLFGLGLAGMGASEACLAVVSNLYAACALMVVGGLFNSFFVIAGTTLVQTLTPTEYRGRVMATRFTVINGALTLGSAAGGVLLLRLPYWTLWLLLGGIEIAASLFIWLQREVRTQR